VTRIINHGVVDTPSTYNARLRDYRDAQYVEHRGFVFFSAPVPGVDSAGLYRYNPATGSIEAVAGTEGLEPTASTHFAVLDDTLYFQAYSSADDGMQRRVYRLTAPRGVARSIGLENRVNLQFYPDVAYSDSIIHGMRALNHPMVVYQGDLYFMTAVYRPYGQPCGPGPFWSPELYRFNATTEQVEHVSLNLNCQSVVDFGLVRDGLLVRAMTPARRGTGAISDLIYVIDNPVLHGNSSTQQPRFEISRGAVIGVSPAYSRELRVREFGDSLFFVGENYYPLAERAFFPLPGPYGGDGTTETSSPTEPNPPFEFELFRARPSDGMAYYDLHPLDATAAYFLWQGGQDDLGSSYPDSFAVAKGALYFAARHDGVSRNLWRLGSTNEVPERITLNPNAPSDAKPIAEFGGRLWLMADTGGGMDLHYLMDDGTSAVGVQLDERVAATAYGFTPIADGFVFRAISTSGETGTWRVTNLPAEETSPVDEPQASAISTMLLINGRERPRNAPMTAASGRQIKLRCLVNNNGAGRISNVRISLRRINLRSADDRLSSAPCTRAGIRPGGSTGCNRSTRIGDGLTRYLCLATARDAGGSVVRSRSVGYTRSR